MRAIVSAITLSVAIALSGCASIKVDEARELAKAGVQTSANFADAAGSVGRGLDRHEDLFRFDLQLDAVDPPKAPTADPNIVKVKKAIAARRAMAKNLAGAYAAFQKLAEYDAAGELSKSVGGALDNANELATALGSKPKIDDKAKAVVGELARLWADYDQAERLHKASKLMRESLESIQGVFDGEKDAWASPIRQAAIDKFNLIDDLMEKGHVLPSEGYFERYLSLSELGLREVKVTPAQLAACRIARQKDPKSDAALAPPCLVFRAIRDRNSRMAETTIAHAGDWVEATSEALAELQALHVAFETKATVDGETLKGLLERAKAAADRLSTALGGGT